MQQHEEGAPPTAEGSTVDVATPTPSPGVGATKLFLGGLSWKTTEDTLRNFFSRFGVIDDAVVMVDRNSRLPRGFGFVTFKDPEAAAEAVHSGPHSIDDRLIDCRVAIPMGQHPQTNRSKKIFVGGLSADTTEEEFRTYFSAYGTVTEAQIMIDPTTNRPRGFGFVTFEDEESVQRVFSAGSLHVLTGKQVEVKAATPKGSGPQPSTGSASSSMPTVGGRSTSSVSGASSSGLGAPPMMRMGAAGARAAGAARFPGLQPGYPGAATGPQGHMHASMAPGMMPGPYSMPPMGAYAVPPAGYTFTYAMPGPHMGGYYPVPTYPHTYSMMPPGTSPYGASPYGMYGSPPTPGMPYTGPHMAMYHAAVPAGPPGSSPPALQSAGSSGAVPQAGTSPGTGAVQAPVRPGIARSGVGTWPAQAQSTVPAAHVMGGGLPRAVSAGTVRATARPPGNGGQRPGASNTLASPPAPHYVPGGGPPLTAAGAGGRQGSSPAHVPAGP